MDNKHKQFEALVRACSSDLYRYAYWLCKQSSLAEDLVQEACLRAWKSLHTLQDVVSARAWLMTIVRNEFYRHCKKNKRLVQDWDEHIDNQLSMSSYQKDAATDIMALRQAIEQLPGEYRELLVLQVDGGFSGDEMAEITGISRNTVMTRVFRARQKLRSILEIPEIKKVDLS
ncbi:MAG TPA: sigma-70 family RNA polymerase sigma factor [Gammaproteobacteria bacterium]|nr:sigma-70 family RNA polymerase sigma factor [Gammaproteobacteria bacterium]